MLLITHDLGVVANVADEIVVMYRGEVMESGTLSDIFERATHPYLRALLRAVPRFDMKPGERLQPIRNIPPGDAPHLMAEVPAVAERPGTPLLECIDIRKGFRLRSGGMFRAGGGPGSWRSTASACGSRAANVSASSARAAAARRR